MRGMESAHGPHGKHLTNQNDRWGNDNSPPPSILVGANQNTSEAGAYIVRV